ncbi:MAG: hypothetical protein ACD_39C01492G0001 [uncultured bacterium]|nr:MAG: hypothetical protein ACD_39C01492G0001 [uncultured bacterium]
MKKTKILIIIICIAGALAGISFYFSPAFAGFAMSQFYNAKKDLWISSVKNDFKKQDYEKYSKFIMQDNSWVVLAMNHDCCSGDGFNCVISKDNTGQVMIDENKNFCGVEAMCNQANELASDSTSAFYSGLTSIGLKLEKINE